MTLLPARDAAARSATGMPGCASMAAMTRFLAGFLCGIGVCLWWLGRNIATPETKVPAWVHDEEALPPFDPHLWRERMRGA